MITIENGVEGKICTGCNVWKALNQYHCYSGRMYSRCKPCWEIYLQERQVKNPEGSCSRCKRRRRDFKDYGGNLDEEFGKHKSRCKKCHASLKDDKYWANVRSHAETRRSRSANAGYIDYYERKLLEIIYGNQCLYSNNPNGPICEKICKSDSDHIVPLAKNGSNEAWNRQPLCRSHNDSKNCHNNIDYRPDQGILAMAIHNLRIGQCTDRKQKKQYYEWVVAQIEEKGPQVLLTLPHIFDWLEPLELQLAA